MNMSQAIVRKRYTDHTLFYSVVPSSSLVESAS